MLKAIPGNIECPNPCKWETAHAYFCPHPTSALEENPDYFLPLLNHLKTGDLVKVSCLPQEAYRMVNSGQAPPPFRWQSAVFEIFHASERDKIIRHRRVTDWRAGGVTPKELTPDQAEAS